MRRQSAHLLFAFPLVLSLSSCGGGGGNSSPVAFPVDAAASSIDTFARNITLTYKNGANTFVITNNAAPGADTSFEGLAAKTSSYTSTLTVNGSVDSTSSGTEYFQVSPFRYLGTLYSDGSYEVASNQKDLPQTATIGASGDFYTSTTYSDSTKSTVTEVDTVTWSLEADPESKSNAYLCENTSLDTGDSAKACYRIDKAGSILGAKVTYKYSDGTSMTFQ